MNALIDQLLAAVNAHDLDAAAGVFHNDYRSEQPTHPARTFVGRAQMRANWEVLFTGIPDFHADICRSVVDGELTWSEWRWSGTRVGGRPFAMSGVTIFRIVSDQIVAGQLYMEEVEQDGIGIVKAVETLSEGGPSMLP